jgi:hypothetical protein
VSKKGGLGGLWSDRENPRRYPLAYPNQELTVQVGGQLVPVAPQGIDCPVDANPALLRPAAPEEWIRSAHYTVVLYSHINAPDARTIGRSPAYGRYQLWTRKHQGDRVTVTYPDIPGYEEAEYRLLIHALIDLLERIERGRSEPARYTLDVYSRCAPMIAQLKQSPPLKYVLLRPLHRRAVGLLKRFDRAEVIRKRDGSIEQLLRL